MTHGERTNSPDDARPRGKPSLPPPSDGASRFDILRGRPRRRAAAPRRLAAPGGGSAGRWLGSFLLFCLLTAAVWLVLSAILPHVSEVGRLVALILGFGLGMMLVWRSRRRRRR